MVSLILHAGKQKCRNLKFPRSYKSQIHDRREMNCLRLSQVTIWQSKCNFLMWGTVLNRGCITVCYLVSFLHEEKTHVCENSWPCKTTSHEVTESWDFPFESQSKSLFPGTVPCTCCCWRCRCCCEWDPSSPSHWAFNTVWIIFCIK